jgi:hypothetical protein
MTLYRILIKFKHFFHWFLMKILAYNHKEYSLSYEVKSKNESQDF